jgi:hypothetical protein
MTSLVVLLLAVILGLAIVVVEIGRGRLPGHVDFLRFSSVVFGVCFSVLPLYLQIADLSSLRTSNWFWLFHRSFNDESFAIAQALALIGYGCIVLGFLAGRGLLQNNRLGPAPGGALEDGSLALVGHLMGLGGLVALLVYTYTLGGVVPLLVQGVLFRSGIPPVVTPYAFLKTLSPLVIAAAFVFYGLAGRARNPGGRRRARLLFWFYFLASLVVLFHQAGRFPLAAFLITFPVATMVRTNRFRLRTVLGVGAFVFLMLLFGTQVFQAGLDPSVFTQRLGQLVGGSAAVVRLILVEFSFPVVTLANATVALPDEAPFRWFVDFPLALEYVLPQRLLGVQHPPTVSMINTGLLHATGSVPADLLSVGYFSAGLAGVVIVAVLFGALLAMFERTLPATAEPFGAILRVGWMFFVGLRVMYGDPQLVWFSGLHLLVLFALLHWARVFVAAGESQPTPWTQRDRSGNATA